jgi:hypothetical protein
MTKLRGSALVLSIGIAFGLGACTPSEEDPEPTGMAGTTGSGGTTGAGGTTGSAGTTAAGGTTGSAGTTAAGGTTGSGGTTGTGGTTGAAGTKGAAGTGAAGTGAAGTGAAGTGEAGTGAAGTGAVLPPKPTGPSAGCGQAPPQNDTNTKFVLHEVMNIAVNPIYAPGGAEAEASGKYNYTLRPYGVRLPNNYDPTKRYAVSFGGGGCGGSASGFASGPNGGLTIGPNPNTEVIQVGLAYIGGCFDDGGPAINNRNDTPEEPYFRAVLDQVEKDYCIDKSKVYVVGFSSGAWEAYTLGCAVGDRIRGIAAVEGGMRAVRPPCKGPVAAYLMAGTNDTENPIGPLPETDGAYKRLGSPGSGPGRDDLLKRNGCGTSTATTMFDPAYPLCKKYTGCPAAYPVIWCELPVGHGSSTSGGINYSPGPMWPFLSTLPAP